jgi:hypothetical protein
MSSRLCAATAGAHELSAADVAATERLLNRVVSRASRVLEHDG